MLHLAYDSTKLFIICNIFKTKMCLHMQIREILNEYALSFMSFQRIIFYANLRKFRRNFGIKQLSSQLGSLFVTTKKIKTADHDIHKCIILANICYELLKVKPIFLTHHFYEQLKRYFICSS